MSISPSDNCAAILYPAPVGASLSDDYTVTVNGQPLAIYRGTVREDFLLAYGGPFSFAYFDMNGSVDIAITSHKKTLEHVVIRPEAQGIEYTLQGETMTFNIEHPCQLSIEPDLKNGPLLLFANPPELDAPLPTDACVKYYGPGLHQVGAIELRDNDTLYLAGGAVVKGGVHAQGNNITIRGRGIIDGLDWPRAEGPTPNIMGIDACYNAVVEGIIIKDGWMWNFNIIASTGVKVSNVKVIGSRCENNDGIDICNSRNVTIEDSFVRTDDDCIAPKGMSYANNQAVENIIVTRCVLWTDKANVWRIACESRAEVMRNMTFSDIDVLHWSDRWGDGYEVNCITLMPAEDMPMENIVFENIRIHCAREPLWQPVGTGKGRKVLMDIRPQFTQWARKKTPGSINNVVLKNITVYGEDECRWTVINVGAPDEDHPVINVAFVNVTRWGELVTIDSPEVQVEGAVQNVTFVGQNK